MFIAIIAIVLLVFLVLIISLALYFLQDKIIFHPEKLPKNYQFKFTVDFEEINLESNDGNVLNGLLFKAHNTKGLVIFYHNHSGNIEHWSRSALFMNKLDHDVLLMDYRGFGKSTGNFNEASFLEDANLWYNYGRKRYDEAKISVYGRGLGATFATYVASLNSPKRLCLESPFHSLNFMAKIHYPLLPLKLISKYKFETYKYIKDVKCKVYLFHGKLNKLISYKNSIKLYESSKENTDLLLISDGNHYNLINNSLYLNKIKEICKQKKS